MDGEAGGKTTCSYMNVCIWIHTYILAYVRKVQKDEHKILTVIVRCLNFRELTSSFISFYII